MELIQPPQDLRSTYFEDGPRIKGSSKCWTKSPAKPFLQPIPHIQVTIMSIGPGMATLFIQIGDCGILQIKANLRTY